MLTENLDAQRGAELNDQAVEALPYRQLLLLFFSTQRRFRPLFARAFPGEEPDEGQHQRAEHGEDQACVEEGNRVVFPEPGQQDPRQEGSQNGGHLGHSDTRPGELGFLFKVIGHFRHQRFVRHQNHGVNNIKQQIGQQVVPEAHIPNPHQRVAEHARDPQQNKELTAAKALTEPGRTKVIG